MTELDIWRAASILLRRYNGEPVVIATKRAVELLDQGDHDRCWAWIRIAIAIGDLERKQSGVGDKVH